MANSEMPMPFEVESMNLAGILYALLQHKKLLIISGILFFCIGFLVTLTHAPLYRAEALLQVETRQGGSGVSNAISDLLVSGTMASPADIQPVLIKSRYILMPVIDQLGLDVSVYALPNSFLEKLKLYAHKANNLNNENIAVTNFHVPTRFENKKFKLMPLPNHQFALYTPENKKIIIGEEGKYAALKAGDDEYSIMVNKIPEKSQSGYFLVKKPSDEIIKVLQQHIVIQSLGNEGSVVNRTGVMQISLIYQSKILAKTILDEIVSMALAKDTERKSEEAAKTLEFLMLQLPDVKQSLSDAELALNKYRAESGMLDIRFESRMLLNQLAELEADIEKSKLMRMTYKRRYTNEHPMLIALDDKLAIQSKSLKDLQEKLKSVPEQDQPAVSLMRDVKVKSELYLLLLKQIQKMQVIKAGTLSDVHILTFAKLPDQALPQHRMLLILTYVLIGLGLSCAYVLGRRAFYKLIDDPNWVEKHCGVESLANIPFSESQRKAIHKYKKGEAKFLPLLAMVEPQEMAIEALRSLRISLQFMASKNNIISILGISPSIGKSFISANFSYLLADTGKRVLLIDGDLRKGKLARYFQKNNIPGLTEILENDLSADRVIHKTQHENFDFLACGDYPLKPAEMLMHTNFRNLLSDLSSKYDLIILDTPPILAVSDGLYMGSLSGINFLVIGSGMHQADEIEVVIKRLRSNNVHLNGALFNATRPQTRIYGMGYGKYNYAYYAYKETT